MEMSGLHLTPAQAPMQQHTSPGASKLRVLIVEDSAIIRARLMESLAEIPNIEIVGEVETEASALAAMADRHWDAAVLDLQLKHGTGLGVLRTLRGRGARRGKILVFTNYSFPQYRERSLGLGADYFFDKAHDLPRIREVLGELALGESPAPA